MFCSKSMWIALSGLTGGVFLGVLEPDGAAAPSVEELKAAALEWWEKTVSPKEYEILVDARMPFGALAAMFRERAERFRDASKLPYDLGTFILAVPEQGFVLRSSDVSPWATRKPVIVVQGDRFGVNAGVAALADALPVLPVFYRAGYGKGEQAHRAFDQMVALRTPTRTVILISESEAQMAKPLRKKFAAFLQSLQEESCTGPAASGKPEGAGPKDSGPEQMKLF